LKKLFSTHRMQSSDVLATTNNAKSPSLKRPVDALGDGDQEMSNPPKRQKTSPNLPARGLPGIPMDTNTTTSGSSMSRDTSQTTTTSSSPKPMVGVNLSSLGTHVPENETDSPERPPPKPDTNAVQTPPARPAPVNTEEEKVLDSEPLPTAVVDSPGSIFKQMGLQTPRTVGELRQILIEHPEILRMIPDRKPAQRRHTRVGERYQATIPPCVKKPSVENPEPLFGNPLKISTEDDVAKRIQEREELKRKLESERKSGGEEDEEEEEEEPAGSLLGLLAGGDIDDDDDEDDEDYDFEDRATKATGIVARRVHLIPGEEREDGKVQFLIRWDDGTTSWEFAETLKGGFDDMIDRYEYDHDLNDGPDTAPLLPENHEAWVQESLTTFPRELPDDAQTPGFSLEAPTGKPDTGLFPTPLTTEPPHAPIGHLTTEGRTDGDAEDEKPGILGQLFGKC